MLYTCELKRFWDSVSISELKVLITSEFKSDMAGH